MRSQPLNLSALPSKKQICFSIWSLDLNYSKNWVRGKSPCRSVWWQEYMFPWNSLIGVLLWVDHGPPMLGWDKGLLTMNQGTVNCSGWWTGDLNVLFSCLSHYDDINHKLNQKIYLFCKLRKMINVFTGLAYKADQHTSNFDLHRRSRCRVDQVPDQRIKST